jgi:hypothetical protein
METVRESYRVTSEIWCCTDCYLAYHYGATAVDCETWDSESFSETFNTWGENGVTITDDVCSEHATDGEIPCEYCHSAEYENGMDTFSRARCYICDDRAAGSRYRLQASHLI